ncbi:MAG: hypothetical protein ABS888_00190 [Eubacteriales bacterium]
MLLLAVAMLVGFGVYLPHAWKLDQADRQAEREAARAEALKLHPAGAGR